MMEYNILCDSVSGDAVGSLLTHIMPGYVYIIKIL